MKDDKWELKCPDCGGVMVLRWKSRYKAVIECHKCWHKWSVGIDPCYKEDV